MSGLHTPTSDGVQDGLCVFGVWGHFGWCVAGCLHVTPPWYLIPRKKGYTPPQSSRQFASIQKEQKQTAFQADVVC